MTSIGLDIGLAEPRQAARRPTLGAKLAAIYADWKTRRARRLALQDLMAFSPHLLNDLGITQADIAAGLEARPFEVSRR
jgi:uncharacterized protein YjiS (DUF1127 family)